MLLQTTNINFMNVALLCFACVLMMACQPITPPESTEMDNSQTEAEAEAEGEVEAESETDGEAEMEIEGPSLAGRSFEYEVVGYTIHLNFEEENVLYWEYIDAPNADEIGTSATENITRVPLRSDVSLIKWQEATGVYVTNVLDLGAMKVHFNPVYPNFDAFPGNADIIELTEGAVAPEVPEVISPELAGSVMEYSVGEYTLQVSFLEEEVLRWEYIEAPEGEVGKNAVEDITRTDARSDMVLMSWMEDSGTYVIDVLDLGNDKLYANFITSDYEYFSSEADITFVEDGN